jgi:uncharacterized coiled-coil protein SlyX
MLQRLRRRRRAAADPPADRRIELLERRVGQLENLLEGLQDAVHRESVRRDNQAAELERKTEPERIARVLSEDARKRGL